MSVIAPVGPPRNRDGQARALLLTGADEAHDAVTGGGGDHQSHLTGRVVAGADPDRLGLPAHHGDQVVGGRAHGDRRGNRHAPLAGAAERGGDEVVDSREENTSTPLVLASSTSAFAAPVAGL
jgi:hypothetical protein